MATLCAPLTLQYLNEAIKFRKKNNFFSKANNQVPFGGINRRRARRATIKSGRRQCETTRVAVDVDVIGIAIIFLLASRWCLFTVRTECGVDSCDICRRCTWPGVERLFIVTLAALITPLALAAAKAGDR